MTMQRSEKEQKKETHIQMCTKITYTQISELKSLSRGILQRRLVRCIQTQLARGAYLHSGAKST